MMKPRMFYFGPWDRAGHYFFSEGGGHVSSAQQSAIPWEADQIDGILQPGCRANLRGQWDHGREVQGEALVHQKDGWTALSFWDRSVDTRGACNSTYIAEGTFTFPEMVQMAQTRFSQRWNKMAFPVVPASELVTK